jgi:hypothetical protein
MYMAQYGADVMVSVTKADGQKRELTYFACWTRFTSLSTLAPNSHYPIFRLALTGHAFC